MDHIVICKQHIRKTHGVVIFCTLYFSWESIGHQVNIPPKDMHRAVISTLLLARKLAEQTRTTRTHAFSPPHDYPYYWVILDPKSKDRVKVTNLNNLPKFQILTFWNKLYTRHTFRSCLVRCANIKWIWRVLLVLQSGHDSVHRRTDGQTDGQGETSIPPFQLRWSGGYNNGIACDLRRLKRPCGVTVMQPVALKLLRQSYKPYCRQYHVIWLDQRKSL